MTLMLTDNATDVIRRLSDTGEADAAGLRIAGDDADQPAGLAVALAPNPQEEDQVVEQNGARVYLDPAAAELLEDKVLDASVDETGRAHFVMVAQPT